ncbi:cytochrome c oxidase assembly protein [Cnuibacter sp. UC19_7]|uniref:cytochrome c oxidase assembly protein n=1 Tax=Cnuibacter sp. UC19_7 TaxID=3350166 RepID=UPI00366A6EDF
MGDDMWMPDVPPTLGDALSFHLQPYPVVPAVCVVLLALYALAVASARRQGTRWPMSRSVWWLTGIVSIALTTATAVDGFGMESFGIHMLQHMVLNMLSPLLLVLGCPVSLVFWALPHGAASRIFSRRTLLRVLGSRVARALTHPLVVGAAFLFSLYGIYFTVWFTPLMNTAAGHNTMLLMFLATGYLYFWSALGVDLGPRRVGRGHRGRLYLNVVELAIPMPIHSFFGVVVMMSATVIVPFFSMPMYPWIPDALADQGAAGGIAWGFTAVPTLIALAVILGVAGNATKSRNPGRSEEHELEEYNAYLASWNEGDRWTRTDPQTVTHTASPSPGENG